MLELPLWGFCVALKECRTLPHYFRRAAPGLMQVLGPKAHASPFPPTSNEKKHRTNRGKAVIEKCLICSTLGWMDSLYLQPEHITTEQTAAAEILALCHPTFGLPHLAFTCGSDFMGSHTTSPADSPCLQPTLGPRLTARCSPPCSFLGNSRAGRHKTQGGL